MNEEQEKQSGTATDIGGAHTQEAQQGGASATDGQSQAKSYTQGELDAMFKDRAERASKSAINEILSGYGVGSKEELDALVSAGKKEPDYKKALEEQAQGKEKLAFALNGISPEMEEEVRFYFKGKGIELTDEALKTEMKDGKHSHWKKHEEKAQESPTQGAAQQAEAKKDENGVTITAVGSVGQSKQEAYNERLSKFLAAAGIKSK